MADFLRTVFWIPIPSAQATATLNFGVPTYRAPSQVTRRVVFIY
jgi:hypothetical protein